MKHGTYSEALKAGFTEEQAGFFARMCTDTKDEIYERVMHDLEKREKIKARSVRRITRGIIVILTVFGAGVALGFLV